MADFFYRKKSNRLYSFHVHLLAMVLIFMDKAVIFLTGYIDLLDRTYPTLTLAKQAHTDLYMYLLRTDGKLS